MRAFKIDTLTVGPDQPLLIIAGPCVIETLDQCLLIGQRLRDCCKSLGFSYVFKASFDKANRSSITSPRGPGLDDGLNILAKVRQKLQVPVTTDLHESGQAKAVGQVVDLVQIPAFLCRQTDLLVAAARTGKPVNVKKGQFLSPAEMTNVVTKLAEAQSASEGDKGIMLTERGTFFGYNRLVNDFIGLADMMDLGYPVCFDVTHSTQQPGGLGTQSGGRPDRAPLLAKLAVTAGVQALFLEAHPHPKKALSDAATMLTLEAAEQTLADVAKLRKTAGTRE
ncbi:MAG: 3-deoxy-8-phosphooctulonate synthase [Phycisphaeraceae bacterium]